MPRDVTDVVRSSTDLSKEPVALKNRLFRLRQLEVKPGGIVPWHSHNERPAMIYFVSGEVVEYASSCAVPIVHKAGDVVSGEVVEYASSADRAQGRRRRAGEERRVALAAEHRRHDGRADLGRPVPAGNEDGRAHDVTA